MVTMNIGIEAAEAIKRYLVIKETNVFGGYEDSEELFIDALEISRYIGNEYGRQYHIVIINDMKQLRGAISNIVNNKGHGDVNNVIFTKEKISNEVKDRARDLHIEIFDETSIVEVIKVAQAFRNGINIPNFKYGRLKYYITHAVKYDIINSNVLKRTTVIDMLNDKKACSV